MIYIIKCAIVWFTLTIKKLKSYDNHFFYSHHRDVFEAGKSCIKVMITSGVSPWVTMRNFIQEVGDPDKVSFLAKDMYYSLFAKGRN